MRAGGRPRGVFVGLATLDVVHRVQARPGANEKVTALAQFVAAGGPAANAAVTFSGLGGDAVLVTVLGTHPVAAVVRADLGQCGVLVVDAAPSSTGAVPISAVSVSAATGDRSVVGGESVAADVDPPAQLSEQVTSADVVVVDGHHPRLALAAAAMANAAGIPVIVDAGRWKPVMAELIPRAGAMVCSNDFRAPDSVDSGATALALLASGVPIVVTTHGGAPIRWWQPGTAGEVEVPRVPVLDTLGAGDAFHGAYAYYSARDGSSLVECLTRAARVASQRVSQLGPRDWLGGLAGLAGEDDDGLSPYAR